MSVKGLHVLFKNIFELELMAALSSLAYCELANETSGRSLGILSTVLHPAVDVL